MNITLRSALKRKKTTIYRWLGGCSPIHHQMLSGGFLEHGAFLVNDISPLRAVDIDNVFIPYVVRSGLLPLTNTSCPPHLVMSNTLLPIWPQLAWNFSHGEYRPRPCQAREPHPFGAPLIEPPRDLSLNGWPTTNTLNFIVRCVRSYACWSH